MSKLMRVRQLKKIAIEFKNYRKDLVVLTVLGFLSGLLEGIGITTLIPIFSIATGGGGTSDNIITRSIENLFLFFNIDFRLSYLLIFTVSLFTVKAIVLLISNYIRVKITADFENNTRIKVFGKVLQSSWPHLLTQKIGHLENVLMTDVRFAGTILQKASNMVMAATGLIVALFVAVNISPSITAFSFLMGILILFLFKPLNRMIRKAAADTGVYNKKLAHFINENVVGMKVLKSTLVSMAVSEKATPYFNELRRLKVRLSLFKTIPNVLMQPISLIFIVFVFVFSYKTASFSLPSFIVVMYLIQKIFQNFSGLQSNYHTINETVPYLRSVQNYLDSAGHNREVNDGNLKLEFEKEIEFKNISFSYRNSKSVLTHTSFSIKKGKMVGLVGESGSGKSTIVDVVLRLLDPVDGVILVDGVDLKKIDLLEWRSKIGYVSQDIFLINDTVANNIKFYDRAIDDTAIEDAIKMAHADEFIKELPNGLDTVVGDRGVELSQGQRQRIVIARALARRPQILILDEATSALDNESEMKIQDAILALKGKVTILVVAHRLQTVMSCDKLLVLEGGRVIEEGPPKKLLSDKDSVFFKAYNIRK